MICDDVRPGSLLRLRNACAITQRCDDGHGIFRSIDAYLCALMPGDIVQIISVHTAKIDNRGGYPPESIVHFIAVSVVGNNGGCGDAPRLLCCTMRDLEWVLIKAEILSP